MLDLISGRGLKGEEAARFQRQMLQAYPIDPALGCPFDGADTNYGVGAQYKRMAAIATDGTYAEAWTEFLETFSSETKTWGLLWEQPIHGVPPEYGITHGSDLSYYFPSLLGREMDPHALGNEDLTSATQRALINFINDGDPNSCMPASEEDANYRWPLYSEGREVTVMNASKVTEARPPPRRGGFSVIHQFLRPGSA